MDVRHMTVGLNGDRTVLDAVIDRLDHLENIVRSQDVRMPDNRRNIDWIPAIMRNCYVPLVGVFHKDHGRLEGLTDCGVRTLPNTMVGGIFVQVLGGEDSVRDLFAHISGLLGLSAYAVVEFPDDLARTYEIQPKQQRHPNPLSLLRPI